MCTYNAPCCIVYSEKEMTKMKIKKQKEILKLLGKIENLVGESPNELSLITEAIQKIVEDIVDYDDYSLDEALETMHP